MSVLKTIAIGPAWPLIWLMLGFDLDKNRPEDERRSLSEISCYRRAMAMVNWWRGKSSA